MAPRKFGSNPAGTRPSHRGNWRKSSWSRYGKTRGSPTHTWGWSDEAVEAEELGLLNESSDDILYYLLYARVIAVRVRGVPPDSRRDKHKTFSLPNQGHDGSGCFRKVLAGMIKTAIYLDVDLPLK